MHRIGRTGRAGATGTAYTFFSARNDSMAARELITILGRAEQEVPDELSALAQTSRFFGGKSNAWRGGRGRGGGGRGFRGRGGGGSKRW